MPLYDYKCPECGRVTEETFALKDYRQTITCHCGAIAHRHIGRAPTVRGDYPGYKCPVSGDWIEGRVAHEANLRKHGCRVLEPGETARAAANREADDLALDRAVEESSEAFVSQLDGDSRAALGKALEGGANIDFARK